MTSSYRNIACGLALVVGGASATAASPVDGKTDDLNTVSYSWLQENVFRACYYCHASTNNNLTLMTHDSVLSVVTPGDPENSLLYQVLISGRMPKGPKLSDDKINAIYQWIKNGAPNN